VGRGVLAVNDKKYRSLAKYVGSIAKDLGLSHYDLQLHPEEPGGASDGNIALASYEGTYGRYTGTLRVHANFDAIPPESQRNAIIHELLHAHTEATRELLRTTLAPALGASAYEIFWAAYTQADERFTDALATAIADNYPLWEG
jgi:hypothetical protein